MLCFTSSLIFHPFYIKAFDTLENPDKETRAQINNQPVINKRDPYLKEDKGKFVIRGSKRENVYDIYFYAKLSKGFTTDDIDIDDGFNEENILLKICPLDKREDNKYYKNGNSTTLKINLKDHIKSFNPPVGNDFIGFSIYQLESEKNNLIVEYLSNNPNYAIQFIIQIKTKGNISNRPITIKTNFVRLEVSGNKIPELISIETNDQTEKGTPNKEEKTLKNLIRIDEKSADTINSDTISIKKTTVKTESLNKTNEKPQPFWKKKIYFIFGFLVLILILDFVLLFIVFKRRYAEIKD
ncbi:hypothetical protein CDIK_3561 [Cucumispora dikerogammari]|nr:hypothetical protein CDIK_3561 [Cucumispora dikerogammari]